MKKIILVVLIQIFTHLAFAGPVQEVSNQSAALFNEQRYAEAVSLLETVKDKRKTYPAWYYYYGINQMGLGHYDFALAALNTYIKRSSVEDSAKAYYYVGLVQFYKGDYEKAETSLDLALDVSNDPALDTMTEALIDKNLRYQNYYETSKKTNLTFFLGYSYDTNVLNLAPSFFTPNLSGHIVGYGASISHKFVDHYNFIFEPGFAVLDSYTLDSSFKADSTLQASDALQYLLSAPIRFYFEEGKNPTRADLSLNGYAVYLPITSTSRDLALSSFFVKGEVTTPLSAQYSLRYDVVVATDKAYGYTTDDDNASGLRTEFLLTGLDYLSDSGGTSLGAELGADFDNTKGSNARYKKYLAAVSYGFAGWNESQAQLRLGYQYLNYADLAPASRTDNQVALTLSANKTVSENGSLAASVGWVSNSSNTDLYRYSDALFSVQYTHNLGF